MIARTLLNRTMPSAGGVPNLAIPIVVSTD
jgi:hypothetical protein